MLKLSLLVLCVALFALPVQAGPVFFEDFGSGYLGFGPCGDQWVSPSIQLAGGTKYILSFDYLAQWTPGDGYVDMWGGSYYVRLFSGGYDTGNGQLLGTGSWTRYTYSFTPLSTFSTGLVFGDGGNGNARARFDNLMVEEAPEPATLGIFAGLAVCCLVWRPAKRAIM